MTAPPVLRAVGLFLLLQGVLLGLASGRSRTIDEHSLHFMAESFAAEGSFAVPQLVALGSFYGKTSLRNEPYAPYSPGQPVVAAGYLATLGPWFRGNAARPTGEPLLLANQAATSLLSTTVTAALAVIFLLIAEAMGTSTGIALVSSLLLVVSTPFLPYSKYGFSEPLVACLVGLSILGLVRWDRGHPLGVYVAGVAVTLTIAVKFAVGGLLFGAVALALLRRAEGRTATTFIRFAVGPLLAIALHLAWNHVRFGFMWDLGYPAVAELGRRLNDFDTPLLVGVFGLLLSPGKGLLFFAPGVVAAAFGLRAAYRRSPSAVGAGALFFAGSLVLYGKYSAWEGGYCVGPRYLLPALPFLWLGLPHVLAGKRRALVVTLCVIGLLAQVPAVTTSFTEDQIMGGRYYDETYRYRFDYTPLGHWALAMRYLPGLFTGEAWDQPLGLGVDFWFVFLVRAGFSRGLVFGWFIASLCFIASGAWLLRRSARHGGVLSAQ